MWAGSSDSGPGYSNRVKLTPHHRTQQVSWQVQLHAPLTHNLSPLHTGGCRRDADTRVRTHHVNGAAGPRQHLPISPSRSPSQHLLQRQQPLGSRQNLQGARTYPDVCKPLRENFYMPPAEARDPWMSSVLVLCCARSVRHLPMLPSSSLLLQHQSVTPPQHTPPPPPPRAPTRGFARPPAPPAAAHPASAAHC